MVVLVSSVWHVHWMCLQVGKNSGSSVIYTFFTSPLLPFHHSLCSVKWVGLFVIVLVGVTTIKDLWDLMGDLELSMVSFPDIM